MFSRISNWFKLRRICKELGLKYTFRQKRLILSPQRPMGLGLWKRGSGKTTAACLWTLLHAEGPIDIHSAVANYPWSMFPVPDPDLMSYKARAVFTGKVLAELSCALRKAGISVAPVYGYPQHRYGGSI